jgi:hypothetical protein
MDRRAVWTLCWGNPYTQPPNGEPRTLAIQVTTNASVNPSALLLLKTPGDGYAVYCTPMLVPPSRRKLSDEAKQKIQRRNLERRIEAKAPLFKPQLLRQELESNPSYFGHCALEKEPVEEM